MNSIILKKAESCNCAIHAARSSGTVVSYDLNYRESLCKGIGGKAQDVNRELVSAVDVLFGNEGFFRNARCRHRRRG